VARISLGSSVKEGPRRGTVVAHRPKGMVDVQFADTGWVERRPEKRLRKGNPDRRSRKIEGLERRVARLKFLVSRDFPATGTNGAYAALKADLRDAQRELKKVRSRAGIKTRNPEDLQDPDKEQFRRVVTALYTKFYGEGYSKYKSITVRDGKKTKTFKAGQKIRPHAWASALAWQIATRKGQKEGWLKPGTQTPTAKGRRGSKQKLKTDDAWAKEQRHELMLSRGRKSGKHRVVPKKHGKRTRYYVQPGGQWYYDETKALARRDVLNGESADEVLEALELVANPRRRSSKKEFVEQAWAKRAHRLPAHDYKPRRGLEGPFQYASGKVLYWDPREGKYWDPSADLYLDDEEAWAYIAPRKRKNWVPLVLGVTASVATLGDIAQRRYKDRKGKKKKKKGKNPREYSELGGMSRGFSEIPSAARNALADARAMGRLRGQRVVALDQVPPSRKQRFQDARRDLEADIDELDHNFDRLSKSVLSEIPGGDYGRTEPARRAAIYWLRRVYREGSNEVLAERERKRRARRARTANPKKKRMKGIAKTGIGYHWAGVRTPKPFQGMKPTLYREEGIYYLVYEGKSRKIPRVLADSNSEPGLKGPKWKRDPRVTSRVWSETQGAAEGRYVIEAPASGRGSERDPYKVLDTKTGKVVGKSTRRKDAEAYVRKKQGSVHREHKGFAGQIPITAYRTTSRSRAAYVAKHLTFLEVPRGTFEEIELPKSGRRREQVGAFKLYAIGTRPPADRRRKFIPRTYTLVVPRGAPFVNRQFASPEAAAKYALRQRVQEGGKTLREQLQSLGKRMPDYQALSAAQAAVQSEVRRLRLYGFDVDEQSEGRGRERVVTYTVSAAPQRAPELRLEPVTLKHQDLVRDAKTGREKTVTTHKKAYRLLKKAGTGGWGTLYTGTKAGAEAVRKKAAKQKEGRAPKEVKAAQRKLDSLVGAVDKVEARLDRLGTPGRPPFILLAHGEGGGISFTEEGFDLTGPVATVSVSPDRAPSLEQIFLSATDRETKRLADLQKKYTTEMREYNERRAWYEDKARDESNRLLQASEPRRPVRPDLARKSRSLGHRDLDWLGALRMKQAQLSPGGKRRLRERREERAMSELQTPTGRSPGVRAPSKRQALVSQFEYRQRDAGPRERLYAKRPERGARKLTKVQKARKRQELAELEAELAAMQEKKNPFAAIARGATWVVSSPTGRKILAEAAVIGAMMVGEKLMKRGKVSPEVLRYVQARIQKETGRRPSEKEITAVMKQIDPNQDKTLTAGEVARILKRKKR